MISTDYLLILYNTSRHRMAQTDGLEGQIKGYNFNTTSVPVNLQHFEPLNIQQQSKKEQRKGVLYILNDDSRSRFHTFFHNIIGRNHSLLAFLVASFVPIGISSEL